MTKLNDPIVVINSPLVGVPGPLRSTYQYSQTPVNPGGGVLDGAVSLILVDASIEFIVAPKYAMTTVWEGTDTSQPPIFKEIFAINGNGVQYLGPVDPSDRIIVEFGKTYTSRLTALSSDLITEVPMQILAHDTGEFWFPVSHLRGIPNY